MKPYKLDLSQFTEKVRDEISFIITNVSEQPLDFTLIGAPAGMFEITLPKSIGAGKSGEGKLKIDKSYVNTSFEKSFTFEVNDEQKSRFTIPVKRTLRSVATQEKPEAQGH